MLYSTRELDGFALAALGGDIGHRRARWDRRFPAAVPCGKTTGCRCLFHPGAATRHRSIQKVKLLSSRLPITRPSMPEPVPQLALLRATSIPGAGRVPALPRAESSSRAILTAPSLPLSERSALLWPLGWPPLPDQSPGDCACAKVAIPTRARAANPPWVRLVVALMSNSGKIKQRPSDGSGALDAPASGAPHVGFSAAPPSSRS